MKHLLSLQFTIIFCRAYEKNNFCDRSKVSTNSCGSRFPHYFRPGRFSPRKLCTCHHVAPSRSAAKGVTKQSWASRTTITLRCFTRPEIISSSFSQSFRTIQSVTHSTFQISVFARTVSLAVTELTFTYLQCSIFEHNF